MNETCVVLLLDKNETIRTKDEIHNNENRFDGVYHQSK